MAGIFRRLAALAAGLAAFGSFAQTPINAGQNQTSPVGEMTTDEPGGRINVPGNGCVLANNVWDRKLTPAGFAQSVFVEKHRDGLQPGWHWNAPGERSIVLGMPEIICGDKPWDTPLGLRPEFPFRAGEKRPLVSFDIGLEAQGHYNMAFSFWAVSKLPAVQKNISLEIMVWNVTSGDPPSGEMIGSLDAAGTTYDIYLKKDQGMVTGPDPFNWPLVQFVARKPVLKGAIDFGAFLDELMKRKILARGDYLTSFELGNEILQGSGRVVVKKLDVRVE